MSRMKVPRCIICLLEFIFDVVKNGGAQQAGLTKGSVITGLEGTTISDMNSPKEQLQYYRVEIKSREQYRFLK